MQGSTTVFSSSQKSMSDFEMDSHYGVEMMKLEDPYLNLLLQKRFLITQKFSEGQFGQVYLAEDLKHDRREVLVKI